MKILRVFTICGAAAFSMASWASGQVLFSDDFDTDTSADWEINTSSIDTSVDFAFDYSDLDIPPSPNGGGTTLGLRLGANIEAPATAEAVTLSPVGEFFDGPFLLSFDMWINANGPFPGGGGGSTEFLTAGVGYDDLTVNQGTTTGIGGWFAVTGEGGSSRDYRAYKNAGEQFAESTQFKAGTVSGTGGGAHNSSDGYYSQFGGIDVAAELPQQASDFPQQSGTTNSGSAGFAWHEVTIEVGDTTALWSIDGLEIVELRTDIGSTFDLEGNISIGYMDIFSSVSDNPDLSFGVIDNLAVVEVTPGLECDLNGDSAVDAADSGILFSGWGSAGDSDVNGDGITDAADASICFAEWTGDSLGAVASVSVPEPASGLLLFCLAACSLYWRRANV